MLLLDKINEYNIITTADGSGGVIKERILLNSIECKVSQDITPQQSQQFGLQEEQLLHVVSLHPLDPDHEYEYQQKYFSVRAQTKNSRYCYTTLIQIV